MLRPISVVPDPKLDLLLERVVDVPREHVWAAWTRPELIKKWFTPAPWQTVDCEIDLRPGGIFRTVMRGPQGQEFANTGCYLELIENERLIWTGALQPGYRPPARNAVPEDSFLMTAAILLQARGKATQYKALVLHGDEPSRIKHEKMGFHEGWGKALDQLVALAKAF
ncbi:MAG TPA: SRPBCC family protein [Burkholderiaceae bacterium]|nr:SRPBCC family protein [Burkholderiaceae bacterium]